MISIFPLGARPGTIIEAEIRGRSLDGAYAIWLDAAGIQARIKRVDEIDLSGKKDYGSARLENKQRGHRVALQVEISPTAKIRNHSLRLVSPRGVSNTLPSSVDADPTIRESTQPHHAPDRAQAVSFPVVVNGKIGKEGELDYYGFNVTEGQELERASLHPQDRTVWPGFPSWW